MHFDTEDQLDSALSEPPEAVIDTLARLPGDIMVLGVAGKMGPTLARMARRASDAAGMRRRIIGVARFSSLREADLQAHGIETIRCDLLNEAEVERLPDAPHVVFMTGRKFGSTGDEPTTWAMNAYLPALICRKYRHRRLAAFSTGNVYGMTPVDGALVNGGGSREEDQLQPVGEYAMSCLGRERMFEYFSKVFGLPISLIRLNYACELRYGILVDLAQRIWGGQTIDLTMGYFNIIWQGDANAMALRALADAATPPYVVNVTGAECLSVRAVCEQLGQLMNRPVRFAGSESASALLSNSRRGLERLGPARIRADQLIEWVARWVAHGGRTLNKPTHFESRDGRF